jgi:hypothetical protein
VLDAVESFRTNLSTSGKIGLGQTQTAPVPNDRTSQRNSQRFHSRKVAIGVWEWHQGFPFIGLVAQAHEGIMAASAGGVNVLDLGMYDVAHVAVFSIINRYKDCF